MRYLVTGANGILGGYLLRQLADTTHDVHTWKGSGDVALNDESAIVAAWRSVRPDIVIHAGAMARVADCHGQPELARQVNTMATQILTQLAEEDGARLVYVSTDMVFDGVRGNYSETDAPSPLSVYGRTKRDAEPAVLAYRRGIVVRVSLLFGQGINGRASFFDGMLDAVKHGRPVNLFVDEWRTPLSLAVAAQALIEIVESEVTGLLHVGGPERLSRAAMGERLCEYLGASKSSIVLTTRDATPAAEPRPRDTSLDSTRWRQLFPKCPWPDYRAALLGLLP